MFLGPHAKFHEKMDRKKLDPDQAETRAVSIYDYWLKEYQKIFAQLVVKKLRN